LRKRARCFTRKTGENAPRHNAVKKLAALCVAQVAPYLEDASGTKPAQTQ
jgi:hypothetical protein